MSKLLKYLKPYIIPLILAIAFLALQAYGELTLPEVMSELVNTGIQQSGIDSPNPEAIRETEMQKLLMIAGEENQSLILDNYKLLSKDELNSTDYNKYIKKYPSLENENIYILNASDKNVLDSLENIMGKSIFTLSALSELPPETLAAMQAAPSNSAIMTEMQETLETMSDSVILQSAIAYLQKEYEAIGIKLESVATSFLINKGGYMLILAFIIMIAVIIESFLAGRISAGLGRDLRKDTFEKVVSFSSAEFDKFSTSSLLTRTTNDVQQFQGMIGMLLRTVVYAPIIGIGGIIKVMRTESSMAWIIAVAVGIMLCIVIFMVLVAVPRFKKVQIFVDNINLAMRESLSGILVVRAFSNQAYEEQKFDKSNHDLTNTHLFISRVMSAMMPLMMLIMNGVSLLIIWVGASKIDMGQIQVGDMMAFINYAMQIIMSFLMISMVGMFLPRAMVSATRIAEVLQTKNSIYDPEKGKAFLPNQKGIVEFKNVYFKYPGADEYVLKDISFKANPGETTAFIGSTGSGKSTVVNLIPRFYDVTEGIITVGGVNVKEATQHDLRNQIGYIPQKGVLFSGTIESNIKFGGDNISDKDMKKSAEIAQASEFIEQKSEKYSELISQGGVNVSGGQKQRLSIARALAKKPQIYIFDDSFSALDYKTDSMLRKSIQKELGGSTVLIVAQRIGTIKNAEQIVVLDQGEIVGIGTHRELLSNCEVYKQIALSQLSQEELDKDLAEGSDLA